ncbi:MAG TPA: hypothetical protein DDZ88_15025 [Verrucomicrobiales bacterium]|nr:hypothetical protein [Verrucomicrobiales bacterium]
MAVSGLMTMILIPNPAPAATVYWDLNADTTGSGGATPTGTWNADNTFWNPLADGTGVIAAWAAGDIAVFSAGSDATGAFTINVDGTQGIGGLRFEEGQVTLAGGTLALAADSELFVAAGLEAAVSSLFSGNVRLTKTGAGTLVLSGNSTDFTGALVLQEGTLRAVGPNIRALGAGTLELNGGVLHLQNAGNITFGRNTTLNASATIIADAITAGSVDTTFTFGTLNVTNAATLTLNRGANITGSSIYGRATFGATTLGGNLTLALSATSITTLGALSESVAGRSLTLTGGSNSTSILILNGASTLTGGFVMTSGRVYASVANSLGPSGSTTTVNAGNLELRHVNAAAGTQLIFNNTATLSLIHNGTVNWSIGGGITHNGGTLTLTSGRSSSTNFDLRTHTLAHNLALNGNLVLNPGQETTLVLGGVISELSGARAVTKSGLGIARLDAAASYSGVTTISNGVLRLGIAGALPSGAGKGNLTMNPGTGLTAVLDLNGFSQTLNGLSSSGVGTSRIDNTAVDAATLTIGAADGGGVFAGVLHNTGGALSLVKTGAGVITLSGANTYSGQTTVNAGVLQFAKTAALYNGSSAAWTTGNLLISSGGTLALNVGGAGEFTKADVDLIAALGTADGGFQSGSIIGLDTTNAGGSFTYDSILANTHSGANSLGLIKLGAGTLILGNSNTYSGGTVLAGGVLSIGSNASLGAAGGSLTMNSGTTLQVTGTANPVINRATTLLGTSTFEIVAADNTVTLVSDLTPGGTLTKTGAGTLVLNGGITSTSNMILTGGLLRLPGVVNIGAGNTTVGNLNGAVAALDIVSGADFQSSTISIGGTAGGTGALRITGGTVTTTTASATAGVNVGTGGYGALMISGGSLTTKRLSLYNSATGTGVLQVSGGTLNVTEYIILSNLRAEFTVTGGQVLRAGATQNLSLGYNLAGTSVMNMAGGLVDNTGRNVSFGQAAGTPTIILNLGAGTLLTNALTVTNTPTAVLNFNGGTLQAAVNTSAFVPFHANLATLVNGAFGSFAGGAVFDTNGRNVTVSANLAAPTGNGVSGLTLTSGGSGYIGAPYVEISGGGGFGATGFAVVDFDPGSPTYGSVISVVLTNPGTGYTGTPDIILHGGGGTGAVISSAALVANTSGGLTKNGAGILTLNGINTYTGRTTVNAGVLLLAKTSALYNGSSASWTAENLLINSGGTLALNVGGLDEFTLANVDLIAALGTAGGGFQSGSFIGLDTTNAGGSFTYDSILADTHGGVNSLGLMKLGAGTLILGNSNTYSGGTVVAGGVLSIGSNTSLGAVGGSLTLNGGTTLQVTGTANLLMNRAISLPGAATLEVVEAANTLTLTADLAPGGVLTKTGAGTLRLTGDVTSNSNVVVGAGSLAIAGNVNTNAGTTTLGSAGNMGRMLLESGSSYTTTTLAMGATNALGSLVIRGGQLNITTPTLSAGISLGGAGYGGLFLSSGSVFTNRVDTIDGLTPAAIAVLQVSGGTLNTADYIMFRNQRWDFTVTGGEVQRTGNHIALAFRSGSTTGNATTTAEGAMTVAGGLVNNAGFLVTIGQQNTATALGTGHLNLNAGTLITNQILHYNATGVVTTARVNFNGGLLRASANTTLFLGTTGTGGTGTLNAYVNGAFGSFAGGAVIDSNGFNVAITTGLLAPTGDGVSGIALTSGGGGGGYSGAPYVEITGGGGSGATASATVDLDPASLTFGQVLAITVTNPGVGYTSAPTVALLGGGGSGATVGTVSTAANTSGGLVKNGAGILTLGAVSTYTGGTTINAGTLALGVDNALAATGAVKISGGTLDLNTRSNTLGVVTLQSGAITSTTGVLTSDSAFHFQEGDVSAILNGAADINKTTTGTVTLSGANTFTGAVNATGGVLAFNSSASLGVGTALTVDGATLSYTGSDAGSTARVLTVGSSGAILDASDPAGSLVFSGGVNPASTGAITKTGAGTIVLTGTTDLNGAAVTVNAGTLQAGFGTDGIGALTIGAGAVMDFRNDAAQALGGLGNLTIGDGARLFFELNGSNSDSLATLLAATVTGTITLNFSALGAGVTDTTYNLISAASGLSAANFVVGNGISGWNLSLTSTDSLISLVAAPLQTRYWRGGTDFSWDTLANWSSDAAGTMNAPQLPASASSVIFSAASAPFSSGTQITTTLNSAFTIDSLRFESAPTGVTAITIQPGVGGVLTLAPQSVTAGIEVLENAGAITLAVPVVVATPQTWTVADTGAALEVSGGLAFTHAVTKTGTGALTLSGNNSGSGGLLLQSGQLNLNSVTALGTGLLSMSAGTILDNTSGSAVALGGATYLWGGNFAFGGSSALHLGSGAVTLADTVTVDTTAGSLTVGGVISSGTDNFGLVKTGAGTLTLGGVNTYLGGTVLNQGTLAYTATQTVSTLTFGSEAGSTSLGALDLSAASLTVSGAALVQTNSTQHNTISIGTGQTLLFNSSFVIGYDSAFVTKTRLTIAGAGTFKIGDVGAPTNANVQVGNSLTTSVSNAAVLDMSGLAVFYANLGTGTFRIGDISNGGGGAGAGGGGSTVILAPDSTLIATTISLDSNTLATQTLSLGAGTNLLQANQFLIGGVSSRGQGVLNFHTSTGSVVVRDRAGTGRAIMNVQNGGSGTAGTLTGLADFSGHHADLLLSTLGVGGRTASTGIGTGTFIFDTGVLDAQTVTIATRTSATVTASNITGTMTLGGTTAGTSVTFGAVTMATNTAATVNSTGNAIATLNISGLGTTSISALNMGVLGLTGASAGTGAGAGTTATVNISGSTTTLGALSLAVNNSTATGATTATSALNISGGSVSVTSGISMGATSGNALNVVNNSLALSGGSLSVGGGITYTNGVGTENVSVTLNGGSLDMNGHAIGAADAAVTFNAQSGTLRNLGELNDGGVLTKSTAGVLIVEGSIAHSGGTLVSDGTLQLGTATNGAAFSGAGLVTVVKTGTALVAAPVLSGGANGTVGTGIISGSVIIGDLGNNANRGVLALGFGDPAASNTTLVIQGASGLTIAGGSQLQLSLTNATTHDAGILAALGMSAYVNALDYISNASPAWISGGPAEMVDHDFLQITGGLQLGTRNGGGTVAVIDHGYLSAAQSGDVFNLLDWAGLMSGDFNAGSGFSTGGEFGDFDLPTLTGGLSWDTSAFTTHGVILVVPEPSIMQFAFIGLATLLLRRRRRQEN